MIRDETPDDHAAFVRLFAELRVDDPIAARARYAAEPDNAAALGRYERSGRAAATAQIDDVAANTSWFGGYRKDALRAVGR